MCGCRPGRITGKTARMEKQSTEAPIRSAGVMGRARWEGHAGNGGGPLRTGIATSTPSSGWRFGRASDRVIVLTKAGNAAGGKDPDF